MLAFFCSLFTSLIFSGLLVQAGILGSCFEGSCGYAASFIVTPILTLLMLPLWRSWSKRWGQGTRIIMWMLVVWMISGFTYVFLIPIAFIWSAVYMLLAYKRNRSNGLPTANLFIKPAPVLAKEPSNGQ